jgi:hypothetical protein
MFYVRTVVITCFLFWKGMLVILTCYGYINIILVVLLVVEHVVFCIGTIFKVHLTDYFINWFIIPATTIHIRASRGDKDRDVCVCVCEGIMERERELTYYYCN